MMPLIRSISRSISSQQVVMLVLGRETGLDPLERIAHPSQRIVDLDWRVSTLDVLRFLRTATAPQSGSNGSVV
jgi:hypothetical protein